MSPRSTPRDPGDDEPTPPRGVPVTERRTDSAPENDPDDWDDEDWEEPNYLVRRALVVGAVVVAIAAVAVGASRFIGNDGSSTTTTAGAEWDSVVVLTADEITLLDGSSGDEIATYPSPDDLLDAQSVVAGDVLVTMSANGQITQFDLSDGSTRRGRAALDETLRISGGNPEIAIAGTDSGGDITIIDTRDRSVLSVADVANLSDPLIFTRDVLVNPGGTHVAVPVPTAFQSVVVDLTSETSRALAGRVIAIDDERVVTEQPAGDRSELEFYDLVGERLGSVDVAAPKATLLRSDGSLLIVARDGAVRIAHPDGSIDELDDVVDPDGRPIVVNGGDVVAGGSRLVATGPDGIAVLDTDGRQIVANASGLATPAQRAFRCIVVGSGRATAPSSLIDVESGDVVTEIKTGLTTTWSLDGCTLSVEALGAPRLVSPGRTLVIDASRIEAVAPDGSAIVTLTTARRLELVDVSGDDATGDEVVAEIAGRRAVVRFGLRS